MTTIPPKLAAAALTEDNRPIRLRLFDGAQVLDDVLLVKYVSGTESICGGIEYRVSCVSAQAGMQLKRFVANPVELQFVTDRGQLRSVCGVVAAVTEGGSDGGLATYQLLVRDALSLLDKTVNTRVFRNADEVHITNVLLREWRENNPVAARAFDFELGHLNAYPAREFTLQSNESTGAFLRRLWKRRGIAWFIRPGSPTERGTDDVPVHTLVLFDDAMTLPQNRAGSVRYHRDDATETRDTITGWHAVRQLTAGAVTRRSWDYARVAAMESQDLGNHDQGMLGNQFAGSLDDYLVDVPHAGDSTGDYRSLGTARMQRHEYESKYFQGEGSVRDMCVGQWNAIEGHPELDTHAPEQREFVITELRVQAENNLPKTLDERAQRLFALNRWYVADANLGQASAERGVRYTNHFTCVRRGVPIVPAFDPRTDVPRAEPQSVFVVGPAGEDIHCDELGRVKVRFPGCRDKDHAHAQGAGASDSERDSAWVRVASGWASAQYGAITLPRIGDEVICVFLGGDPDKPLIVGRVHDATKTPPSFSDVSRLPGDRYLSGIKSHEGKGQRYNQLRLDDTPGQISAQLESAHGHAQLNLGFLTHPRSNGAATPRGAGFELTTNDSGALRTAKSLLISAWKRLDACGNQLSSEEHIGLMQDCLDLFKSLGQYAAEHQGLALDPAGQAELKEDVAAAATSGKPTVSVTAPEGIAVTTPKTLVSYAGVNVDTVAQQHMQLTSGQRFNLNAGKGISLFSHMDGIAQIAHHGKFLMQSQHDDMQIDSAKDVKATAGKRFIVMAEEEVTLIVGGGAYLKLKGGNVELGGPGSLTVKTDGHHWNGPASASTEMPKFEAGDFSRTPRLLRPTDGKPVEGMKLHVEREGDSPLSGQSNAAGEGEKITGDTLQRLKAFFYTPRS
ncbi:type VI secretion system Vgr family protein [Pseudoduganella chitinolytica]|uniref:Type VI secretion system Vgr family protein n=1 Tax=Pseudoduganella chitinolytica TaxID=34070 RepID=A0ABY8BHG8_9BURK|nr:type VI secretion system Vgr family protein [Pseudoduganella chitinolytica]WEF35290.1 type VI secretion system Vgr family protein [Pseudoduganella chitinolytica]